MPLCPQITNTPITVTQTADFTVSSVLPVVAATTTQLDEVIVLADGKTKAFYQATAPTVGVSEGDIWFDTDDGNKQYYYNGTAWVSVQDTAIAAATSAAAAATAASAAAAAAAVAAQTTADGKNKIYRQASTPTGTLVAGDLWFDTDDDNRIYRYDGSSFVANTLGNNALASISANKITAGTIDASVITVSNINAGNISTGTLAADRILAASITGSKIAANTITAANITAGTITATEIAAGTITAAKIAAGTITATEIAAGTITTDKLVAGTLTGFVVQTSAGSNAVILNGGSNAIQFKNGGTVLANMVPLGSGGLLMHYGTTPDPNGGAFPQIFLGATNISINVKRTSGIVNTIAVDQNSISLNAEYTYANERFYVLDTSISTAAPNGRIDSDGRVRRTTGSSIRFKDNVVDLVTISEIAPSKLLELPVRAFKFKADYLDSLDNRVNVIVPGFIAEEMDNFYPAAADYDAEGNPENWNERFIIPGMLALIQDLYKEIAIIKGE
jgi:hypothetical protein